MLQPTHRFIMGSDSDIANVPVLWCQYAQCQQCVKGADSANTTDVGSA